MSSAAKWPPRGPLTAAENLESFLSFAFGNPDFDEAWALARAALAEAEARGRRAGLEEAQRRVEAMCRCIPAYKDRDMVDPQCQAHDCADAVWVLAQESGALARPTPDDGEGVAG